MNSTVLEILANENSNIFDPLDHLFIPFCEKLHEMGFGYQARGGFRSVWHRKRIVIKIPQNVSGLIDNAIEAKGYSVYKNEPTKDGIVMAPCRLLSNGCLMMAKVDTGHASNVEWSARVDNGQVGKYKNRYVAYDYALNLSERHEWEKEWRIPGNNSYFQHAGWKNRSTNRYLFPKPEEKIIT